MSVSETKCVYGTVGCVARHYSENELTCRVPERTDVDPLGVRAKFVYDELDRSVSVIPPQEDKPRLFTAEVWLKNGDCQRFDDVYDVDVEHGVLVIDLETGESRYINAGEWVTAKVEGKKS